MATIIRNQAASADTFDRVWASLSSADRIVLLGHDRDELTPADKVRLAKVGAALRSGRDRRNRRR